MDSLVAVGGTFVIGGVVLGALVGVIGGGELFVVVLNAHMFLLYFYFIF